MQSGSNNHFATKMVVRSLATIFIDCFGHKVAGDWVLWSIVVTSCSVTRVLAAASPCPLVELSLSASYGHQAHIIAFFWQCPQNYLLVRY